MTCQEFKKAEPDLSPLGLEKCGPHSDYFCTPKGASVLGKTGVDGIHFCVVRGLGETVFSVSPMNSPGDYVHPVANTIEDFLRLLLACGDTAAIEQAHGWTQEQFDDFLRENQPTAEQRRALAGIRETFDLEKMEEPFAYLKKIQADFDYRKLKFKPEYEEWAPPEPRVPTAPEWKVYFSGSFFQYRGHGRAGKEISVNRSFPWGDAKLFIPAVYSCADGLVLDLCLEAEESRLRPFLEKWQEAQENESPFSDEQREAIEAEHPLNFHGTAEILLNGRKLSMRHGVGTVWIPESCRPEGSANELEAGWIAGHYGLDPEKGWGLQRIFFPWEPAWPKGVNGRRKKPSITSLEVILKAMPVPVAGPHMKDPRPGDSLQFSHPVTGMQHRLTVQSCEQQELTCRIHDEGGLQYPTHCVELVYTLSPNLSDMEFSVRDCGQSDPPRQRTKAARSFDPVASGIAIIGGADGPTAVFMTAKTPKEKQEAGWHAAYSSLHFCPPGNIEWRLQFREKLREDITVTLI